MKPLYTYEQFNEAKGSEGLPLECYNCGCTFLKEKKYISSMNNTKNKNKFCSRECNDEYKKSEIEVECLNCGNRFNKTLAEIRKSNNHFCSKPCFAKHNNKKRKHTEETKNKISKTLNGNNNAINASKSRSERLKKEYDKNPKCCRICNSKIEYNQKHRKTCSKECYKLNLSNLARKNKNCGGETNWKKHKYNGVWMDSSWEVEIAKWLDEKDIKWERTKKHNFKWIDDNGKERLYFPDFYLKGFDVYLDPKNEYLMEKDENKLNRVMEKNDIELIYGPVDDIKEQLEELITK